MQIGRRHHHVIHGTSRGDACVARNAAAVRGHRWRIANGALNQTNAGLSSQLSLDSVGLWVPYLGAEAVDGGDRALQMGFRFASDTRTQASLELGQRVPADRDPELAIRLTGSLGW